MKDKIALLKFKEQIIGVMKKLELILTLKAVGVDLIIPKGANQVLHLIISTIIITILQPIELQSCQLMDQIAFKREALMLVPKRRV